MRSPFPGMDPFIEFCRLWTDFHDALVAEIQRELSAVLPPRYVARLGQRTYIDQLPPDEGSSRGFHFVPDVAVQRHSPAKAEELLPRESATAADGSVEMMSHVAFEQRETILDIWEFDPQRRLVTSIEVLSPSNKRWGGPGWEAYHRKRNLLLEGHANLVEIDLLRGGSRPAMASDWPESPYYLLIARKTDDGRCRVWPAYSTKPLPDLVIPLLPADADLRLGLQAMVDAVYARSRYDSDLRYRAESEFPLTADELALIAG